MKRRGIQAPFLIVLTFLCLPIVTVGAQGVGGERLQADAFLAKAEAFLDSGSLQAARAMIGSASELAPAYSETLYLRARLELTDQATTTAAIEDLRSALRNALWTRTDPAVAEQALAEVLLRTGKLAEARSRLERLVGLHPEDSSTLLLLARTFARSGDRAGESRTLSTAAVRFPLIDDFRLLASSLLESQGRRAAAVDAVATGLKVHPDSQPLLLAAARLETDARKKTAAVERYLQAGGADPLAAVMGIEASRSDRQKYLDLFIKQGGLARQDLIERVVRAVSDSKDLTGSLHAALSAFSGARDLDSNSDGFWEEHWIFDKGVVTRWTREPAQDGVAQYSAVFLGGQPVSLTYSAANTGPVTLRYSQYPFIETAAISPGGTYVLVPYTLQSAFLQGSPSAAAGLAPRVAARFTTPTVDQLRKSAYEVDEYKTDGGPLIRRTELSRGVPVFMEEDANGDGVMDHRVWYAGGAPVKGERSLSGAAVFPVSETWRNGRIASVAIDTDGDGKVDYRESYGAKPVKSWDYNEDGRDDSREYPGQGGTVVRDFSTSLNGVFDLAIVFNGGKIARVTAGGASLPVTTDTGRGVTWIGQPAAGGARPDLSIGDGIQRIGGRNYLLFRYQGIVYAEAVR